jgi:type IV pilus assembly protein PilQ
MTGIARKHQSPSGTTPVLPVVLWLLLTLFATRAAADTVLKELDTTTLPGGQLQIRFHLSQPLAAPPASFTINEPARIVIDFPDTRSGLSSRQQAISSGVAEKVNVLQGSGRTRASINLTRLVPYKVRTEGNTVLLTLEAGAVAKVTPSTGTAAVPRGSVGNIDFHRSPEGGAVISFKLSNPAIPVDVRQEGNQIVVDFQGALLPVGQQRRLDVTDFATPVNRVDALNQGNNARITIQPTAPFEYLAYQADDLYTIEVKRPKKEEERETDARKKVYTGELLSLNFQNIDIRAVLQIISDFTGQNVVVSDSVQGNLTLRLQNVPWDQALDIILRTKGLTMRQNGNVMYIAPTEEVAAREKLELEARKTVTELVPLRTELIQVNYAKASELAALLKGQVKTTGYQEKPGAPGAGGEATGVGSSILSPRGQVTVDPRTNSLLVQDIPEKLTEIRDLITRLDRPVKQVMIDSRVVIANDDFSKELGIRWGYTGVTSNDGGKGIVGTTGTLEGTSTMVNSAVTNLNTTGQINPIALPPLAERIGVNLPVTNPFGQIALAILGKNYLVDLELSAMQSEGRGDVLSNPRVVTTDRAQAVILQGRQIPYQTVSQNGTQTEFKDAVLELTVTPQITPDDRIIMDLDVKKDEVGANVGSSTGAQIPSIDKREVKTQVLVNNGDTVVLGGVFEQTTDNTIDKVPFLGDLPAIGWLFKRKSNTDTKRELLIFVTPQILKEGLIRTESGK